MRRLLMILLAAGGFAAAVRAETPLAPAGALRAVYLAGNPAQAIRNVSTGEIKGASADLAREIAKRHKVELSLKGLGSPAAVIEAVKSGEADIGFVAPNNERTGVAFTQAYMLVQQSFLVKETSDIKSVADIDKPNRVIGANNGDSVAVYLKSWLKQATLKENADFTLQEPVKQLNDGTLDAFAANRQRLGAALRGAKGLRMLPDNLYGVPQTIAISLDKPEALAALDKIIDELRASGFIKSAIDASGVDGVIVAPGK
ncbi:transporter substrate-binding domain-containing protein [Terrarubrum flagellatum]|uniref:transporter substrate-binding domain-containing protein n=1 Tax=Terrirubrum flagellatum TaxID=2895980 RepID=UPI0031455513